MTGRFYFYFCPTGDICIKALLYEKNIEVVKVWTAGIQGGRKWRQREEMGGKISPTVAKNGSFALNTTNNGGITVDFWIVKVHTSD